MRAAAIQDVRVVALVLEDHVHVPLAPGAVGDRLRDLAHDVRLAVVGDGVHGIQAQAVEVEFLDPVERVVNEEVAHRAAMLAVEVDRGAPRRLVRLVEELRRVALEVVALGAEVVVDHVEQHHDAARVRFVHEPLEILRRSIGRVGRERQHAVVTPVARAGKVRHGHDLERRHARAREVVELADGRGEGALGREGADVQLVDDRLRATACRATRHRSIRMRGGRRRRWRRWHPTDCCAMPDPAPDRSHPP
jgi:hypothetical protein